jgi:hypothetical protein
LVQKGDKNLPLSGKVIKISSFCSELTLFLDFGHFRSNLLIYFENLAVFFCFQVKFARYKLQKVKIWEV